MEKTVRLFGEAGLKCIITELDMGVPSTTTANLEEQARNYRVITDIVLNNDNCPNLVIWGLKDNDSWRSSSNPLLYNSSFGKKKAWYAVRSALRHRYLQNEKMSVGQPASFKLTDSNVYTLAGVRMGTSDCWSRLPQGIYIVDGKLKKK
jgi:hypothetical protein